MFIHHNTEELCTFDSTNYVTFIMSGEIRLLQAKRPTFRAKFAKVLNLKQSKLKIFTNT